MDIIRTLLTASLLTASLDGDPAAATDSFRRALKRATPLEWEKALENLKLHKVLPLIGYVVSKGSFQDAIPDQAVNTVRNAYKKTLLTNTVILTIVGQVVRALRRQNVEPTLFKGVVLADSFYPDPGTRAMVDVDVLIRPGEQEKVASALEALGFKNVHHPDPGDAVYYGNQYGVLLDVHYLFRIFENKEPKSLTVDLRPKHIDLPTLRVWEPNAMLIHLVTHLEAHRGEHGYRLSWIMDLGFLIRRWGDRLEWQKLRFLARDERSLLGVVRLLRFLDRELGVPVPATIAAYCRNVRPLSLGAVLRSVRLAPWGLPGPRGWARLIASRLGLASRRNRPYPKLSDLLLWPVDLAFEKAIPGKIARPASTRT